MNGIEAITLLFGLAVGGTLHATETTTIFGGRLNCVGMGFVEGVAPASASGDVDGPGICAYLHETINSRGFWPPRGPLPGPEECRIDGGIWLDGRCVFNKRPGPMPNGGTNLEAVPIRYNGKRVLIFVQRGATKTPGAAMPAIFTRPYSGFLVQSRNGRIGNFEVVVQHGDDGLAHFWRDNDAPGMPWKQGAVFAKDLGRVDAVTLIQSTFSEAGNGPGNLEVIARIGDRLVGFWRPDTGDDFRPAAAPEGSFTGNPALIQSRFGSKGNFELVVPLAEGGLAHFWRDNDAPGMPWKQGNVFAEDLGRVDTVALIQSSFSAAGSGPGNFEIIAGVGNRLVAFWHPDTGGDFRPASAPPSR